MRLSGIAKLMMPMALSCAFGAMACRPRTAPLTDLPPMVTPSAVHDPAREHIRVVFERTQHGPFDDVMLAAARRWQLDPFLLKGLLANESRLDPQRVGKRQYAMIDGSRTLISGGALGIAQFTRVGIESVNHLRSLRQRAGEPVGFFSAELAADPTAAIPAAAELLAHLINRFGRDGGITAYNSGTAGGRAVKRFGFWQARCTGQLVASGAHLVQAERFLLNVLEKANWYRQQSGLPQLEEPTFDRSEALTCPKLTRLQARTRTIQAAVLPDFTPPATDNRARAPAHNTFATLP